MWINCDVVAFEREFVVGVREWADRELGLKPYQVLLSATHTHTGPGTIHLIAEASRRAWVDSAKYLGDPETVRIPYRDLLSEDRARIWRASIDLKRVDPPIASAILVSNDGPSNEPVAAGAMPESIEA